MGQVSEAARHTLEEMQACGSLEELERIYKDQPYYGEVMDGYMAQYAEVFDRYVGYADMVAEFGVHRCASSTYLLRRCSHLYSWETNTAYRAEHDVLKALAGDRWTLTYGDSKVADMPLVDTLFIDSGHTYEQMKGELAHAPPFVQDHIIIHDATTSWWIGHGNVGGIGRAVREFLAEGNDWAERERIWPAPGMMILSRV